MELVYSRVEKDNLLHIINRIEKVDQRVDIVPAEEFLQLATFKLKKGTTFQAHKHIYKPAENKVIAQESWVILSGKVEFFMYDLDDSLIKSVVLNKGDSSITLRGGHNYVILEDDTVVYEYKTGPYKGQELDKEFINGN